MPSTSPKKKAATTATTATATAADVKDEVTSTIENTQINKDNNTFTNNSSTLKENNKKRTTTEYKKKRLWTLFWMLVRAVQVVALLYVVYQVYWNPLGVLFGRPPGLYVMDRPEWSDDTIVTNFRCATATTSTTTVSSSSPSSSNECPSRTLESMLDKFFSFNKYAGTVNTPMGFDFYSLEPVHTLPLSTASKSNITTTTSVPAAAPAGQKKKKTFIRTLNESIAYMEDPESVCASLQLHTLFSPVRTIVHARKDNTNKNNITKQPCHFIDYGVSVYYKTTTIEYYNDSTTDNNINNRVNVTFDNDLFYRHEMVVMVLKAYAFSYFFPFAFAMCGLTFAAIHFCMLVKSFFVSGREEKEAAAGRKRKSKKNRKKEKNYLVLCCSGLLHFCRQMVLLFLSSCPLLLLITNFAVMMLIFLFMYAGKPYETAFHFLATDFSTYRGHKDDTTLLTSLKILFSLSVSLVVERLVLDGVFSFCFRCVLFCLRSCCYCCCGCCIPLKDNKNDDSSSSDVEEEDECDNEK